LLETVDEGCWANNFVVTIGVAAETRRCRVTRTSKSASSIWGPRNDANARLVTWAKGSEVQSPDKSSKGVALTEWDHLTFLKSNNLISISWYKQKPKAHLFTVKQVVVVLHADEFGPTMLLRGEL